MIPPEIWTLVGVVVGVTLGFGLNLVRWSSRKAE